MKTSARNSSPRPALFPALVCATLGLALAATPAGAAPRSTDQWLTSLLNDNTTRHAGKAGGSLQIKNRDVVDDHYIYSLDFQDLASSGKFEADVHQVSNMVVMQQGLGPAQRNFVAAVEGAASAGLVYRFDFSATKYLPTSLALLDYIMVTTPAGTLIGATAYSVDGVAWTRIRSKTSSGTAETSGPAVTTIDFRPLPRLPEVVYYKVDFEILDAGFPFAGAQWGRVSAVEAKRFVADFTVLNINTTVHEAESLARLSATDPVAVVPDPAAGGGSWLQLNANAPGDQIVLAVPVAEPGSYAIKASFKSNPNRGVVRLAVDGVRQGPDCDQYVDGTVWRDADFGVCTFATPGVKRFAFSVVGRNPQSNAHILSIDSIRLAP